MTNLLVMSAEAATEASVANSISDGVNVGFTLGTEAFNFIMANPLSSTVVGIGFCYVALGIIKRALRVSKRM